MCRLFGFRSVILSQVHRSLVAADNALGRQSSVHPDGWGVAFYVDGSPHITRSPSTALSDALFHRVSGVVSSETVLAHVRRATVGAVSVLNCHPFQYGRWIFAHNGEVHRFPEHREKLVAEVAPRLRRFILGETDSEVCFFMFLTELSQHGALSGRLGVEEVIDAMRVTVKKVRDLCDGRGEGESSLLTFLVTDGTVMLGAEGGKELFWSTYKGRCADRETCPSLAHECEHETRTGFVNHLIFSSEPLQGENVWLPFERDEVVAVDRQMRLVRGSLVRRQLQVVAG
jgi:glutamine amidotransferase